MAEPLLAERGMELVELNARQQGAQLLLQLLVDLPSGITLSQCTELNRALNDALAGSDVGTESYLLEVASPGLDRPLRTHRDFERVAGQTVTATLHQPFAGQHQLVGNVVSADEQHVTLETKRWGAVMLPLASIAKAVITLKW